MSEKRDQEYFSDGLSEELIELLGETPGLRVIARTSSFYFKGRAEKLETIAAELRVANILEGSVRKSGDRLRVTAQLIRADTSEHLWSETFDRDLHDVFKVQDEIASAVVTALTMGGKQRLTTSRSSMRGAARRIKLSNGWIGLTNSAVAICTVSGTIRCSRHFAATLDSPRCSGR
jgi:TolB-like protein